MSGEKLSPIKVGDVVWILPRRNWFAMGELCIVVSKHLYGFSAKNKDLKGLISFNDMDEGFSWTRNEQEAKEAECRILRDELQRRIVALELDVKTYSTLLAVEHSRHTDRVRHLTEKVNEFHDMLNYTRLKLLEMGVKNVSIK